MDMSVSWNEGHACDFSQKVQKKGKIFKDFGKNVQNLKIFWKRTASCVQQLEYTLIYIAEIYMYIYKVVVVFTTERFLELAIASWPEWDLNPRPLQTLWPTELSGHEFNSLSESTLYSHFNLISLFSVHVSVWSLP